MKAKANEIIELKNALEAQLSYGPVRNDVIFFRDVRNVKIQYWLDKNLDILEKEVKHIEKAIGLTDLLEKFRTKHQKETAKAKTDDEKKAAGRKVDAEYAAERQKFFEETKEEFEISLYELKGDLPDELKKPDRAQFWILKRLLSEKQLEELLK